jgi:hypothetical protein
VKWKLSDTLKLYSSILSDIFVSQVSEQKLKIDLKPHGRMYYVFRIFVFNHQLVVCFKKKGFCRWSGLA